MAAKGGRFTSGGSPNSPKTVTHKPTAKGYTVTNKSKGTTRAVTTSTPTVIVSSDDGVVTGVSGTGSRRAKRKAVRARKAQVQRTRALALLKKPEPQKAAYQPVKQSLLKQGTAKAKTEKTLKSKPVTYEGNKTAGTPTLKALEAGSKSGTLKVNKKGFVTTRPVRRVGKELKQAKKAVAKAKPRIKGITHGPAATRFAERLAKETGLDAKAVGAWVQAEGGGSSGSGVSGGEAGRNNWLGVGYPGYQTSFAKTPQFNLGPERAAKATANWMRGKTGGAHTYNAAQGIEEIIPKAKGKGSAAFLRALDESGWGTGVENVAANLSSVSADRGSGNPKAAKKLKKVKAKAKKLGLHAGKPNKQSGGSYPAKKAKKLKGAWAGSRTPIMRAVKGLGWIGGKRTPEENAAVEGATDSDHLTTNISTFAADIDPGTEIAEKVAKRLGIQGWAPGTYERFSSPKYPGYSFQLLWEVEGHYDHVHVGAEWTGEDLPAGAYKGGAGLGGGSGTGTVSGAAITSYAAATGQTPEQVAKKLKAKKGLTPTQIYKKLESLGVGVGTPTNRTNESAPSTSVLERLEAKYSVAA